MSTITLPNIRVSSDLEIRLKLKDGGVAIDWSTLTNIKASIYSDRQRSLAGRCDIAIDEEDSTTLVCRYSANKPQYPGVNRVIVCCTYDGETKTYDKPAFTFVRWTDDQAGQSITIDDPDIDVEITVEDVSSSILQEAVEAANSAAERANDAAAAAEHMVDIHQGPAGPAGADGSDGKSAYEIAVDEGFVGTEAEWLESLVGPQGPQGIQGIQGIQGEQGPQGEQGNTGSSVDYPFELVNNEETNDATKAHTAAGAKRLNDKIGQLEAKADKLGVATDDSYLAENFTKEVVDFISAPTRNYNLVVDTTKYGTSTTYHHAIFPAEEGDVIDVTANSSFETRVAFVTNLNLPISGGDVPVVPGTSIVAVSVDVSKRFVAPAGTVAVLIHTGTGTSAPSYMAIYRQKKSYSNDRTMTMVTINGFKADVSTVASNASYYGYACPVKSGKTYLVNIYSAGTATKYFGFVTGIPVVGATINYRDTENIADKLFYLTATVDGYLIVTKASSGFSVSVVEQGDSIKIEGDEKDLALALQYDKKDVINSYTKRNYSLIESTGKYGSDNTFKHIVIPVSPGQYVKVTANSNFRSTLAFLTNDNAPVASSMPNYVPGTGIIYIPIGTTGLLKVPTGASYLLVYIGLDGTWGGSPEFVGIISDDSTVLMPKAITKKSFGCMRGSLRGTTGLYPVDVQLYEHRSHTTKYIRNHGYIKILYTGTFGIIFYDENQDLIENMGGLEGPLVFEREDAAFFRVYTQSTEERSIDIESYWDGDDEVFQKLPVDEGYQPMAFGVNINKGIVPNDIGVSTITTGYVSSLNFGMLHLPASYKETGEPTPLIIYLHGASTRYDISSTRFGTNVRYSPEWDAMGFAQMDVDMIPYIYNTGTSANVQSGTGDDAACVEAAYNWAIQHFNIRRDGVYLFGRSRGGQAVLECLAKFNPSKLPVVCALSNAGANAMLLYGLFRSSNSTFWRIFCESTGLDALNPPAYSSGLIVANSTIADFLRTNIDIWWKKAMVALPMCVDNPTEYQTPTQIFDLLVSSYTGANPGKTFIEDFIEKCKFRSPVPLRFDWCAGDTIQPWEETTYGNYGSAGKDGFVDNKLTGNSIYRRWPSCPEGDEPHYHEFYNLSEYTLPNGETIQNASMAMVEWLLWAMGQDERFTI